MLLSFADLRRATSTAWCGRCGRTQPTGRWLNTGRSSYDGCAVCQWWSVFADRDLRRYWDFQLDNPTVTRPADYPPPRWTLCR